MDGLLKHPSIIHNKTNIATNTSTTTNDDDDDYEQQQKQQQKHQQLQNLQD